MSGAPVRGRGLGHSCPVRGCAGLVFQVASAGGWRWLSWGVSMGLEKVGNVQVEALTLDRDPSIGQEDVPTGIELASIHPL